MVFARALEPYPWKARCGSLSPKPWYIAVLRSYLDPMVLVVDARCQNISQKDPHKAKLATVISDSPKDQEGWTQGSV